MGIIQWIAVFRGIKLNAKDVFKDNIRPFAGTLLMLILLLWIAPVFEATVVQTLLYGGLGMGIYFVFMFIFKDSMVDLGAGYLKDIIHKRDC